MSEPIFKPIFGLKWEQLPPALKAHYANRPFTRDVVTVEGLMKVEISTFARLLSPLLRLAGALVPYAGDNIPVTVHFRSNPRDNTYGFDREFRFPHRKPFHFRSFMRPVGADEVIEVMPIGVGWRARYRYDGTKITMRHRGYAFALGKRLIPLPLTWLIGQGNAEEEAMDEANFRMYMDLRHPLFGKVYEYSGVFKITEVALDG